VLNKVFGSKNTVFGPKNTVFGPKNCYFAPFRLLGIIEYNAYFNLYNAAKDDWVMDKSVYTKHDLSLFLQEITFAVSVGSLLVYKLPDIYKSSVLNDSSGLFDSCNSSRTAVSDEIKNCAFDSGFFIALSAVAIRFMSRLFGEEKFLLGQIFDYGLQFLNIFGCSTLIVFASLGSRSVYLQLLNIGNFEDEDKKSLSRAQNEKLIALQMLVYYFGTAFAVLVTIGFGGASDPGVANWILGGAVGMFLWWFERMLVGGGRGISSI